MQKSKLAVRALLSTASVAVMAAAGLAVAASPAAAATPQCTKSGSVASAYGPEIIPVSSGGSDSCWLEKGDASSAVTALQKDLNCNGKAGTPLTVDGSYGTNTKNAVIGFQKWANANGASLSVDGGYGPKTSAWLFSLPLVSNGVCHPVGG